MFGWTGENESDEDGDVENKKSKKFLQTIYGVLNVTEHLKKKKIQAGGRRGQCPKSDFGKSLQLHLHRIHGSWGRVNNQLQHPSEYIYIFNSGSR